MDLETLNLLAALAVHLHSRREAILEAWRAVALEDPELEIVSKISVLHFENIIPQVLDSFERRLRTANEGPGDRREEEKSHEHGAHRWQEGYTLREVVREWGHLQLLVVTEIDQYGQARPLPPDVLALARRIWMTQCSEALSDSVERYTDLQRTEAEGVFRDLQHAAAELRGLERQRAALWHEAAHDLRGNVGLVTTTTSLLTEADAPDDLRAKALSLLQASVDSLQKLLEDLLGLARLEAGRESLHLETFDAALFLLNLCSALEIQAQDKGLYLRTDGPPSLVVEGDPSKLQRILQNLILNALKYTRTGGITVSWAPTQESDIERWLIRIQDTGPGMPAGPLTAGLQEATKSAKEVEDRGNSPDVEPVPSLPPSPEPKRHLPQKPGEGIGLLIVKRLCELLHATLEVSSRPGEGTVFQIVLPRCYGRTPTAAP